MYCRNADLISAMASLLEAKLDRTKCDLSFESDLKADRMPVLL